MRLRRLALASAVVATAATLAIALTTGGREQGDETSSATSAVTSSSETRPGVATHGLQLVLPLNELVEQSELLVRGTPVEARTLPFGANPTVPEESKASDFYRHGQYREFTVQVHEYLLGSGANELIVRIPAEEPEGAGVAVDGGVTGGSVDSAVHPDVQLGKKQVFSLFAGGGVWSGGWLINGGQGLGLVHDGGTVTMGSGKETSLTELRALAQLAN